MLTRWIVLIIITFNMQSHTASAGILKDCNTLLKGLLKLDNQIFSTPMTALQRKGFSFVRGGFLVEEKFALKEAENHKVNKIISHLAAHNGQVRVVEIRNKIRRFYREKKYAYFRVDESTGYPYVVLEKTSSMRTLIHEYTHFKDWEVLKNKFMRAPHNLNEKDASHKARMALLSPKMRWITEMNAVRAEMKINSPEITSKRYIKRSIYPELVTIQIIYDQKRISKKQKRLQRNLMRNAIVKTYLLMLKQRQLENSGKSIKEPTRRELKLAMDIFSYRYEIEDLYDELIGSFFRSNLQQYSPLLDQNSYRTYLHRQ